MDIPIRLHDALNNFPYSLFYWVFGDRISEMVQQQRSNTFYGGASSV